MDWQRSNVRWLPVVLIVSVVVCAQSGPARKPVKRHSKTNSQSKANLQSGEHEAANPDSPPGPLSEDDGLTVLGAALESRSPAYRMEKRRDCSHLVHAVYEKAGFPYPYAPSSDLYRGAEDFERVDEPQPGDLVVWHGHAGIVVSPRQHTFFSALRTGLGVDNYDSAYWMGRGHPRFFRYVKQENEAVVSGPAHTAGLKATELRRR
jgi:cell wall-associated NlpC family hydrolase